MRKPSVRAGKHYIAEIHVTGRREHVDAVRTAFYIRPSGNRSLIEFKYGFHNRIRVIVVVAVFRRLVAHQIGNYG